MNQQIIDDLFPFEGDFVKMDDFVLGVAMKCTHFQTRFTGLESRIEYFSQRIRQFRAPAFIAEGNSFLGKY